MFLTLKDISRSGLGGSDDENIRVDEKGNTWTRNPDTGVWRNSSAMARNAIISESDTPGAFENAVAGILKGIAGASSASITSIAGQPKPAVIQQSSGASGMATAAIAVAGLGAVGLLAVALLKKR